MGPKICIPKKFPGGGAAAVPETAFSEPLLEGLGKWLMWEKHLCCAVKFGGQAQAVSETWSVASHIWTRICWGKKKKTILDFGNLAKNKVKYLNNFWINYMLKWQYFGYTGWNIIIFNVATRKVLIA